METAKRNFAFGYSRKQEKSKNWYGRFTDSKGKTHVVPLCPDKAASQQMLAKLIADAAMNKLGLVDPFGEHRRRPLSEHLADFKIVLEGRGNTPEYIDLTEFSHSGPCSAAWKPRSWTTWRSLGFRGG